MMKKPIINTMIQIGGKIASLALSLLITSILTRKLGVKGYGSFTLISSLFVFLDSLADFGTKTIGIREMAKEKERQSGGQIFNLRIITATTALIIGLIWVWMWEGMANLRWEATIALLMVVLTSIAGYWEIIFQSKLRMDLKVLMDVCFPAAFLGWIWWWKGEISLTGVFLAYIAARGISLAVGYWLIRGLQESKREKIDWSKIKEIWKMSWPMGVFLMMFATYDRAIDSILIQNYLGPIEVAWYGLAYKIYGALQQPAYFLATSIFPLMSRKDVAKRKLFWNSAIILMAGVTILVAGVYVTAPLIIKILAGDSFGPSIGILRILMAATVFSYIGHLIGFTLISGGGQKEMLKLGAVALIVNLVLNVVLIPRYGIVAAAWVTVVTEAIDMGMMGYFLVRQIEKR